MTGVIATIPLFQFSNALGLPLAGGKLYTYLAGTTTPVATYQDEELTTENENPITLDSTGACVIWLDPAKSYKFLLKSALGITQPGWPVDNVSGAATVTSLQPTLSLYATLVALAATAGASLIGFIQAGVGAVARTVQDLLRERVSINSFLSTPGVIPQAEFDNAAARALAVDGILRFAGSYSFDSLNIAADGLIVECGPKTTLTHTGVGAALQIDGGASANVYSFELRGNPLVVGNANTTDGIYVRSIHHSRIKARVQDVAAACRVLFSVCSKYDITCSINETAFSITPIRGLLTDKRGNGENVQDCEFNVVMEGINGNGLELANTYGCEFTGTSEGNATGIVNGATCARNRFVGIDLESNTAYDVQDSSENATYQDCYAISLSSGNNAEMIASRGAKFIGGYWRTVNCQSTSSDTLFIGVATSDAGGLGFKGPGTFKTINCVGQGADGSTTVRMPDLLGERGTWTPGFASAAGGDQGAGTAVGTSFSIGGLCYVQGFMSIAKGTLSEGAVSITGFPFISRNTTNDYQYIQVSEWDNIALGPGENSLVIRIAPNSAVGTLIQSGTSVPSENVNVSAFPDPMNIRFSGVYERG